MCTALGGSSTNLFSPDGGHIVRTFGFSSHSCYCTTAQSVLCTYLVLRSYKGSWQTVDGKLKSQDPAKRCSQGSKWSRSNLQPRKRKRHMKKHHGVWVLDHLPHFWMLLKLWKLLADSGQKHHELHGLNPRLDSLFIMSLIITLCNLQ